MLLDDGVVIICNTTESEPEPGLMPEQTIEEKYRSFFGDKTIGYGRRYAASGAGERIDRLIRVEHHPETRTGMIALFDRGNRNSESPGQYRITNVQNLRDERGLYYTDLTLIREDGEPNARES